MKTKLSTGVEITYNKKGNIKRITTPYDNDAHLQSSMEDRMYSQQLSDQLKSIFNSFSDIYRLGL